MNLFVFKKTLHGANDSYAFNAIVLAFNRGHAVKLIAKELEARGAKLDKTDLVEEIDLEAETKGRVIIL